MKKKVRVVSLITAVFISILMINGCSGTSVNSQESSSAANVSSNSESSSEPQASSSSEIVSAGASSVSSMPQLSSSAFSASIISNSKASSVVKSSSIKNSSSANTSSSLIITAPSTIGLSVKDGVIFLNGKPFYGMGVNFHGAFYYGALVSKDPTLADLNDKLKTLSDNGIPFARLMFGTFWPNEVIKWTNNKIEYFAAMDKFVAAAEKNHVGIIASLIWNYSAFADYTGEHLNQIGNPNSKCSQLAVEYVTEVVSRYKNSPAIWAWEIGNEGNLGVDLLCVSKLGENVPAVNVMGSPSVRTAEDYITTDDLVSYYSMVGAAIRKLDPYRLIEGGDSVPRGSSKSLREGLGWQPEDKDTDTQATLKLYTPNPMNAVSIHIYESNSPSSSISDFGTMLNQYMWMSKTLKIPLYVGEFGPGSMDCTSTAPDSQTQNTASKQKEIQCFNAIYDAILNAKVQISSAWTYRRDEDPGDYTSIVPGVHNDYQWQALIKANEGFKAAGKTDAANYWVKFKPVFYK